MSGTFASAPDLPDASLVEIRPGRTVSVAYQAGDGDCTVFLCHGAGGHKNQWRHQWRALAEAGIGAVAWDALGHGTSPQPRRRAAYAGGAFVLDFAALFERHRTARNFIVAHSYGVRVALGFLETLQQSDVAGLLLLGPPPLVPAPVTGLFRWAPAFVLELMRPSLSARFRTLAWHPETNPQLVAAEDALTRRNSLFMMQSLMLQSVSPDPALLERLTMPAIVAAGDMDRLTPPALAIDLASRIPDGRFELIAGAGHQMMLEQPARINRLLLGMIGRL